MQLLYNLLLRSDTILSKIYQIGGEAMAKEAIEQIRNAEIEAARLLEEGSQKSKDTIREGEVFAEKEYKRILSEAKAQAEKIKESAVEEGESIARPIIEKGIQEAKDLTNLSGEKLDSGINIIIERIVRGNGNS